MIAASVTTAVTGACWKLPHAAGARLSPMSATMVPVTIGGMTTSIHRAPATWTTSPTAASTRPVTRIPPTATDWPCDAVAAPIGAMNAKLDPR